MSKLSVGTLKTVAVSIIVVTILFAMMAEMIPEAMTSGDALNDSGVPFGNFFSSSGLTWVVVMAGILLIVIFAFLPSGKKY